MADKNFFDLLKDKMTALRPSEKNRDDDWAALTGRLNAALPEHPRERRRALVLPLLLLAALLGSNAAWWQAGRNDRAALAGLEAQVADLRAAVATLQAAVPQVAARTDTVWRTVYVSAPAAFRTTGDGSGPNLTRFKKWSNFRVALPQLPESLSRNVGTGSSAHDASAPVVPVFGENPAVHTPPDATPRRTDLPFLEKPKLALLPLHRPALPQHLAAPPAPKDEKPTLPFSEKLADALRPKFFRVGASAGWLNMASAGLMHESGFWAGMQGQIGLSRHWSLTAAYGMGRLHYKAHDPAAVLGAPEPPPAGHGHNFTGMDVTGQRIRQFEAGLRYTLGQLGKPRPYLGLGWGGQTLLPFRVEYQTLHEPTGTIQQGVFEVAARTRLRNILGLSAGLEIPLAPRFDLMLEGFYQRQWKKPSAAAPDLTGIRAGLNWLF